MSKQQQQPKQNPSFESDETLAQEHRMTQSSERRLNQSPAHNTLNDPSYEQSTMHYGADFISDDSDHGINEILRGEISAKEAYDQVFDAIKEDPETSRLEQLRADHNQAVRYWKDQAHTQMSYPEQSSGVWGAAVEAFVGASKLLGQRTALAALKKGEEHGLDNYQKMLNRDGFTVAQKDEIRNRFIPSQQEHIATLSTLMKMQ